MISIFDSLTHPQSSEDFKILSSLLKKNNYKGACVVGLESESTYSHDWYAQELINYPELIGIAGVNPKNKNLEQELDVIKNLGFKGIKIHPRFSKLSLSKDKEFIVKAFNEAEKRNFVVFLCSYLHTEIHQYQEENPLYSLVSIMKAAPSVNLILMHGGDVRLMEYVELARFNENILIDLSYTILKYKGSSLDLDIQYLFNTFDRRICIGTDYPYFTHEKLRIQFENLVELSGISEQKASNIGSQNILKFLKIDNEQR
tara:strand:+ start:4761 stop:5534 length:774 start_codon:yes stop_codon:yes gene_type:complete